MQSPNESFIAAQIRQAIERFVAPGSEYILTMTSKDNSDHGFQILNDCMWLAYPFAEEPVAKLAEMEFDLGALQMVDWEPNQYVTFNHDGDEDAIDTITDFLTEYIDKVFGAKDDKSFWEIDEM